MRSYGVRRVPTNSDTTSTTIAAFAAPSSTVSTAELRSPGQTSRFHTAVCASSHGRVNFSVVRSSDPTYVDLGEAHAARTLACSVGDRGVLGVV